MRHPFPLAGSTTTPKTVCADGLTIFSASCLACSSLRDLLAPAPAAAVADLGFESCSGEMHASG
jgi:hypothetical protein